MISWFVMAGFGYALAIVWLLLYVREQRRLHEVRELHAGQNKAHQRERQALSRVTAATVPLFPSCVRELREVVAHTETVALDLCQRFQRIAQQATPEVGTEAEAPPQSEKEVVQGILDEMQRLLDQFVMNMGRLVEASTLSVTAMSDVETHTKGIASMLNHLEFVASETSLLSLNASIEAARAGEHGRVFAVVAQEVSKLATQSGRAAADIHRLVKSVDASIDRARTTMKHLDALAVGYQVETRDVSAQVASMTSVMCASQASLEMRVTNANQRAKKLAEDIAGIVVSLQFQDVTRQRIERVATPLEQLHRHLLDLRTELDGVENEPRRLTETLEQIAADCAQLELCAFAAERSGSAQAESAGSSEASVSVTLF